MQETLRVVLADDHALVRRGFRRLLEDYDDIEIVGEAATGAEALELVQSLRPDVAVLDISMPEMDGLQALLQIKTVVPEVHVLILSMHSDSMYIRTARDSGASGYLLKSSAEFELYDTIRSVSRGEQVFPNAGNESRSEEEVMVEQLTPRERQVLQLIAAGKANKEIASILGVSVNTVAVHRARLMDTLGIRGTAELTLFAVRCGLVTPR